MTSQSVSGTVDGGALANASAHRRFVVWLAATVVVLAGGLLAFTLLVNPFGLVADRFGPVAVRKPEFDRNSRLSKIQAVARLRPDLVVLGSSRSDHGISVRNPVVAAVARRPYNLSLDGTRIRELEAYFDHAIGGGELSTAIIGLDFHMFTADPVPEVEHLALLDSPATRRPVRRALQAISASMTIDALRASIATLRRQAEEEPYDTVAGERLEKLFRERTAEYGGAAAYFSRWDEKEAPAYVLMAERRGSGPFAEDKASQFAAFARILERARERRIGLAIFFSPAHARNMQMISGTGQWRDFEAWKREVVRLVDAARVRGERGWNVDLWDFSGYNSVTTESLPGSGTPADSMYGFWDSSHYKRAVGDRVLACLLGSAADSPIADGRCDFGIRLAGGNVEPHLAAAEVARQRYESDHAGDVAEVRAIVQSAVVRRAGSARGR